MIFISKLQNTKYLMLSYFPLYLQNVPFVKSNVGAAVTLFWCRNSQNHLKDFSKSSLNQARHQATLLLPLLSLPPFPHRPRSLPRHPRQSPRMRARNENPRAQTTVVRRRKCQRARIGRVEKLIWNVWRRAYTSWGKMIYCRL